MVFTKLGISERVGASQLPLLITVKRIIKVIMVIMAEKLGNRIVRDLIAKGCSRWEIMKQIRKRENRPDFAWNSVKDWEIGKYCSDIHIPHLQTFRYEWCIQKGIDPFGL